VNDEVETEARRSIPAGESIARDDGGPDGRGPEGRTADGLPAATVVLKPKRARPFFGRHPWVLDSAVLRVDGDPQSGAVVDLTTHDGLFVGRGLWNGSSRIRVRLYAFDAGTPLDTAEWRRRLERAVALRRTLGMLDPSGACRLVNSEGDDLSGLIVDRYGAYLAVQVTALALAGRLELGCMGVLDRAQLTPVGGARLGKTSLERAEHGLTLLELAALCRRVRHEGLRRMHCQLPARKREQPPLPLRPKHRVVGEPMLQHVHLLAE
jgi:hypothetical protein